MRRKKISLIISALAVIVALSGLPALAQTAPVAQSGKVNTNTRIIYHDGPIMSGAQDVYLIWYGCWDANCGNAGSPITQTILTEFTSSLGGSPYFQINAMYPNSAGQRPSGALFYGGSVVDRYSRGVELTASDITEIVSSQIVSNNLPQDPIGIYLVLASADVSSNSTGFCIPGALPHHGTGSTLGAQFKYAFLGNPNRCPMVAASQFFSSSGTLLPTPNNDLPADAMASTMAQLLSRVVTNPTARGWFDRYGFENAAKCVGQFGVTYAAPNGARANLRLGARDYLIQENWVNDRKGHCAMNSSL